MKKLYFLLCVSFIASQSLAQEIQELPLTHTRNMVYDMTENNNSENSYRGGGVSIWSSDFSDPTVWVIDTLLGSHGFGISTTDNGWAFGNNSINSDSGAEYAFVWSGDPGDGPTQTESTITTVNAIDVSLVESAVLEFQIFGARFTDSLKVDVSTDGMNFETVGDITDVGNLNIFGGTATANPLDRAYNVSMNVQGQDSLWVRFTHQTSANGISYGWFLDDVNLTGAFDHDLRIDAVYTGDILLDYEYTQTPLEQAHPLTVGAQITNMGAFEGTNTRLYTEIFLDGGTTPVYTGESDVLELVQSQSELFWVYTGFTPQVIGDYSVSFEAIQDSTDLFVENNSSTKDFEITTYTWANDAESTTTNVWDGSSGSAATAVQTTDGWSIGSTFTVFNEESLLYGLAVSFDGPTDAEAEVGVSLWYLDENFDPQYLDDSEYVITSDDASPISNDFSIIPFDDFIELETGVTYLIALDHPEQDLEVHVECQPYDNDFSTWIFGDYGGNGSDWFTMPQLSPTIRLLTTTDVGVNEQNEAMVTVGQNFPNPMNGNTTIPFTLENSSDVNIRILDVTGKVVFDNNFGNFNAGYNQIEITNLNLNAGIYTYEVSTDLYTTSSTMVSN